MRQRLADVRAQGALPWVGLAWLAGRVPVGAQVDGTTGQPVGGLWWWHVAVAVVVLLTIVEVLRDGDVATRIDSAALGMWSRSRRWTTTVVLGWLSLAVLATVQLLEGGAVRSQLVSFLAAAALVAVARRRVVGGSAVGHLAAGTVALAVLVLGAFALAAGWLLDLPLVAATPPDPAFRFYRVKQAVMVTVGAHNVLAGFLLAGAPAVALVSSRRGRRGGLLLVVAGLGLAATLSRGALVAGAIAVGVAWLLRDRTVARRLGVVVALGAAGVGLALVSYGAPVPDPASPTSLVARTQLWSAAWDAFTDAPMTGVGLDGFLPHSRDEAGLVAPHEHAHDLPLHALATVGLPGALAVAAVWGGIAAAAAGLLDRDRRLAVLVGLAGLGAQAMIDEIALRPATVGLLAILACVAVADREPVARRDRATV